MRRVPWQWLDKLPRNKASAEHWWLNRKFQTHHNQKRRDLGMTKSGACSSFTFTWRELLTKKDCRDRPERQFRTLLRYFTATAWKCARLRLEIWRQNNWISRHQNTHFFFARDFFTQNIAVFPTLLNRLTWPLATFLCIHDWKYRHYGTIATAHTLGRGVIRWQWLQKISFVQDGTTSSENYVQQWFPIRHSNPAPPDYQCKE